MSTGNFELGPFKVTQDKTAGVAGFLIGDFPLVFNSNISPNSVPF